jgi:hypothetical protein
MAPWKLLRQECTRAAKSRAGCHVRETIGTFTPDSACPFVVINIASWQLAFVFRFQCAASVVSPGDIERALRWGHRASTPGVYTLDPHDVQGPVGSLQLVCMYQAWLVSHPAGRPEEGVNRLGAVFFESFSRSRRQKRSDHRRDASCN